MGCCHHHTLAEGGDSAFSIDASSITFGRGAIPEVGDQARTLGLKRVALFTDKVVAQLPIVSAALASLHAADIDAVVYDEVKVEPTDQSFLAAARFAREGFDGYVSVGGGSVMDTCKAANRYATHPAEFIAYVNPPAGEGRPIPGPLKPHIACPTTSGTGSECTGIAVFDYLQLKVKTSIAWRALRPTMAIVDLTATTTLPADVVAASGFDVLSHALESYTALPYTKRARADRPALRPMSQGANPWSDMGCREALRLLGEYVVRAVHDASDQEAREQMMYAATLAGLAFGNAGVHLPHGMSYSIAGLVREFQPAGYPQDEPLVPHGMAVIVNAPAVFRYTANACPQRHLEGAALLGADTRGASDEDAGEVLAQKLIELMRATHMPNGVGGVGYGKADIPALAQGAWLQQRLVKNSPKPTSKDDLALIYEGALSYW
jgi:hydroxyacid-oxoacid transhydrogenase